MFRVALMVACCLAAFGAEAAAGFVEKLKAGEKQKIVCYGTSLTVQSHWWVDGFSAALAARWPGQATVVNAGLSGKNSATGLANVQSKVVAQNPDAVFIEFSMNDAADTLNTGKTAAQALADAEANLKAIIAAVKAARPNCEIILETMNPYVAVAGSKLSNRTNLEAHFAMYRRVAAENGYLLIDHAPRWQRLVEDLSQAEYLKLVPDGVHPNAQGARRVTLPNVLRTLGVDEVEGARDLPVIKDVDVLVVGGTFGAVSAAVAAKEAGASVFLAAPRRNLAEEVVLPRRLTRPADDEDLPGDAFAALARVPETAPLSYTTPSVPNASKPDANNTVLTDGAHSHAGNQSVQYDDATVTWTLTVAGTKAIQDLTLYYYFRPAGGDFNVGGIALEVSQDGTTYTAAAGTVQTAVVETGLEYGDDCRAFTFVFAAPETARHLRLTATRATGAKRMLIGEISAHTGGQVASPYAPLVYEKVLDKRLAAAEVPFLGGLQACDVVRTPSGRVAGVVFADKSGRQVIRAKCVIDATEAGVVARRACTLRPVADDNEVAFTYSVIAKAGLAFDLPGYTVEAVAAPAGSLSLSVASDATMTPSTAEKSYAISLYRFTKRFPLTSGDWTAVNAIAQRMRTDTWTPSLADAGEVPAYVTPERIVGRAALATWTSSAAVPLGAFQPADVEGLYVLGPAADLDRALAAKLMAPGIETALGQRLGAAAAAEAAAVTEASGELQLGAASATAAQVTVHERLERPFGMGALTNAVCTSRGGELPVIGVADVVVVGMGTAGGPAAIAALEKGKSVLGIDYLYTTGGVATDGRIGKYYKGYNRGFTKNRFDPGILKTGWVYSHAKAEWVRQSVVSQAAAEILFGSQVEGVVTAGVDAQDRKVVTGVVVVLPDGTRGVVRASVVIDATGNAEIAHMCGCETQFLEGREFAMQGTGTTYHVLGNSYFNTDFGFLNTDDAGDLSNFAWRARAGAKASRYNVGDPLSGARERRRIVGDIVVNARDILRNRTWSDTIMHGTSDYDMHGFSVSDVLMYRERPHGKAFSADLPYRALIPRELAGVLATGLGISATRDAMPIIRMQRDVQNQGYAAGLAAAAAAATGDVRGIDVAALQQELVTAGCLDARVLSETDADVTDAELAAAISALATSDFAGLEKILSRASEARPLLAAAHASATGDHRLALAVARALVGDGAAVVDELVAAVQGAAWSAGFNFQGLGNYGRQTAPVDYLIHALTKTKQTARIVPVLSGLMGQLVDETGTSAKLSHFRLLTLAVEDLDSRELFTALEAAVARSNSLKGWSALVLADVAAHDMDGGNNATDDASRTKSLIELAVARTLSRGGSSVGAEILAAYAQDPRTIYASYAALAQALPPLSFAGVPVPEEPLDPYIHIAPALVDDGDFEPKSALPSGDRNKQDKRSVRDADWLQTNLSAWTFGPNDANGSGIFNNDSYFSADTQLAKLGTSNRHGAFLRIASGVGPGRISHAFETPVSKTEVTIACRTAARYYNNAVFSGRVALEVDGARVAESDLIKVWSTWPMFSTTLTIPKAGTHMFAFVALPNDAGTCDILIDRVTIGYDIPRAFPFHFYIR